MACLKRKITEADDDSKVFKRANTMANAPDPRLENFDTLQYAKVLRIHEYKLIIDKIIKTQNISAKEFVAKFKCSPRLTSCRKHELDGVLKRIRCKKLTLLFLLQEQASQQFSWCQTALTNYPSLVLNYMYSCAALMNKDQALQLVKKESSSPRYQHMDEWSDDSINLKELVFRLCPGGVSFDLAGPTDEQHELSMFKTTTRSSGSNSLVVVVPPLQVYRYKPGSIFQLNILLPDGVASMQKDRVVGSLWCEMLSITPDDECVRFFLRTLDGLHYSTASLKDYYSWNDQRARFSQIRYDPKTLFTIVWRDPVGRRTDLESKSTILKVTCDYGFRPPLDQSVHFCVATPFAYNMDFKVEVLSNVAEHLCTMINGLSKAALLLILSYCHC